MDGAFVADGKPTNRMIFVHCHGAEVAGNSPTNSMQVEAAEYVVGLTAAKTRTTTQTLVLSPYRAQVDLLTGRLGRSGDKAITCSLDSGRCARTGSRPRDYLLCQGQQQWEGGFHR